MYPNQNQDQYPIDYLNQIAPKPQPKRLSPVALFGAIGAGLLIMGILAGVIMAATQPPDVKTEVIAMRGRMETISKVASQRHSNLRSDDLRAINVNVTNFITSALTELDEPLAKLGIKQKNNPKVAKAEREYEKTIDTKLDEAFLSGNMDQPYAREMLYELKMLTSNMAKVKAQANSKSLSEFIAKFSGNLSQLIKQLEDYIASA